MREYGGNFIGSSWATLESAKWLTLKYQIALDLLQFADAKEMQIETVGERQSLLFSNLAIIHHLFPDSKEITEMEFVNSHPQYHREYYKMGEPGTEKQ